MDINSTLVLDSFLSILTHCELVKYNKFITLCIITIIGRMVYF